MGLKKRAYSVLIVSAAENFTATLISLFSESVYTPVCTATSINAAKRALAERAYDLVFINSPLPDDAGIRLASDICSSKSSVVLLFVKSDIHDGVFDRVTDYGVFTLPKPTSKQIITRALFLMGSAKERLRRLEKKTLSIEEKMEEIRIVNRAKWALINELQMDEADAHRYIEKHAMDSCVSKKEIAEDIIKMYGRDS